MTDFYGYVHTTSTRKDEMDGDDTPTDFSFSRELTNDDYFKLLRRNEYIQIACIWSVREAIRPWITWKKEQKNIQGTKFGKPYTFETFDQFLLWIKFQSKLQQILTWSELNGVSFLFFKDTQKPVPFSTVEKDGNVDWLFYPPSPTGFYDNCEPYHIKAQTSSGDMGIEVYKEDENGEAIYYKLTIHQHLAKKSRVYILPADRVVMFEAPKLEMKWGGSSQIEGIALIALAEEQTFKRLMKRAHDLAGGVLEVVGISGEEEAKALDTTLGDDLSSVDRVFLMAGRELNYKFPDLKAAGEMTAIFEIFTRKIARSLRISKQLLDGDPLGSQVSSAKYNMITSYIKILCIQEHYRNAMELSFYKLGKEDTFFTWNDLNVEDMEKPADLKIDHKWINGSQNEPDSKEEKVNDKSQNEKQK